MNEILLNTGKLLCWTASSFTNSSVCPTLSQQLFVGQVVFASLAVVIALVFVKRATPA